MGFLVNPELYRIGFDNYWKSTWTNSGKKTYRISTQENILINKILTHIIKNNTFYRFGVAISHYSLNKQNTNFFINIYIYDNKDFLEVYRNDYSANKFQFFEEKKDSMTLKWKEKTTLFSKTMISSLIWRMFEKTLQLGFLKLNGSNININVIRLQSNNVTPTFIVNYISYKLRQKYTLPWILRPILRDLQTKKNQSKLSGFKMLYAGRFTRKQIADYSWTTLGKTSLNTISSKVKFGQSQVRLKYGVCALKLWIDYTDAVNYDQKKTSVYPFFTPIQTLNSFDFLQLENVSWQKKYFNSLGFSSLNVNAYKKLIQTSIKKLIYRKNIKKNLYIKRSTKLIFKNQKTFIKHVIYE